MARLILVRHGETDWNKNFRYQGNSDVELNSTGIKQAKMVGECLEKETIHSIYSSDLKRALKTAELIGIKHDNISIEKTALLREMHFGDFEGLNLQQMRQKFPETISTPEAWRNRPPAFSAPNGESIAQLGDRVSQFLENIKVHQSENTLLIVAHGGTLQVMICQLLGIGLEHWWQVRLSSTAVTIMMTSPYGASLTVLNDTCHLQ